MKYPNVYRSEKEMMKVMPFGMVAILASIGVALTIYQGIAYFVQWVIVGIAISLIYRP
jgi:hypothetical protein